jgi:hypothetical protein
MRRISICLVAGCLLLAGCSGPSTGLRRSPGGPPSDPEPYVRIENTDSNRVQLQIAVREFLPGRRGQPVIWLTGVSHIGESNYYAALQAHLDAQTLVLFEGVSAAEAKTNSTTDADSINTKAAPVANGGERASLQSTMASSLGLVFQLEAIDYRRPSFHNSDLSISQLRQLMAQTETGSGRPGAGESFENLLTLMEGNSWFDSLLQIALRFLGANPKLQAFGRLALIDLLGQLQGDPSRLEGLPPELKELLGVLLQKRNEKVLSDLESELPQIGRHGSIAIFFGTGHMPDLERRLRSEFKYRPGQEIWFTAFQVDLAKAKIAPSERAFIENLVNWQLKEAGAVPRGPKS